MGGIKQPSGVRAASSVEPVLLRTLADHYCGVFLIRTLGGFVHNLNSPLQILWLRSEQLQSDVGKLSNEIEGVGGIEAEGLAERMSQRVDSLLKALEQLNDSLSFLTEDILEKARSEIGQVSINEVVKDTLSLLRADMFFKHRVQVSVQLDDNLPSISGRHSDLCVIMLNLIQNALEAMIDSELKSLAVETARQEDSIIVRITDTGCGISEEDSPHVFEPLFTTKKKIDYDGKVQEHAGLGLALSALLVDDFRGSITFESVADATTFTIRLPYQGAE